MSSSSGDEADGNEGQLYSQPHAGPSHRIGGRNENNEMDEDEGYMGFGIREEDIVDVDSAIAMMLGSLRLEYNRARKPSEQEEEDLLRLHKKIFVVIERETDQARKRRLKRALPDANCIREQAFYLRKRPNAPSSSYFNRLVGTLNTIVKESFDEEYRKVATVLGLVEALAEVVILEVAVFGIPVANANEHRSIRKLIANALTNLTYGQINSKRRLCSYNDFVRTVIKVLLKAPNLTQVYAGLVRNLSWMADSEMSCSLRPTVAALAVAAVAAQKSNNEECLKATLSALWNLSSHSSENKKTICDSRECVVLLCQLLTSDSRMTVIVESATGILKYVSQYLSNTSEHLELRNVLVARLVQLLGSSSFTIVTNSLGAIANLITKDPHLQNMIRHDANAISQLNVLRNSAREDIRGAVKMVLNAINQPTGHTRYGEMSSSLGTSAMGGMMGGLDTMLMSSSGNSHFGSAIASPRLLPLRAARASPGRFGGFAIPSPLTSADQRSCSLPRHFARGSAIPGQSGLTAHPQGMMHASYSPMHSTGANFAAPPVEKEDEKQKPTGIENEFGAMHFGGAQTSSNNAEQMPSSEQNAPIDDDEFETSETAMGTRNTSIHSLGSQDQASMMTGNQSGFDSTLDTAANSSRMSPVSISELPPSPTMCVFQQFGGHLPAPPGFFTANTNSNNAQNTVTSTTAQQQGMFSNSPMFAFPTMPGAPAFGFSQLMCDARDTTTHSGESATTLARDGASSGGGTSNTRSTGYSQRALQPTSIASDTTTAEVEDLETPTYPMVNKEKEELETLRKAIDETNDENDLDSPDDVLPGPPLDEDDYAIVESNDNLLAMSIQSAMPQNSAIPKPNNTRQQQQQHLGGFFAPSVNEHSPRGRRSHESTTDSDRFLLECIMSEMPQGHSPFYGASHQPPPPPSSSSSLRPPTSNTSTSKNVPADRRDIREPSDHRPSHLIDNAIMGSHRNSTSNEVNTEKRMQKQESFDSHASSEDSFGVADAAHFGNNKNLGVGVTTSELDTSIPLDCFDEDTDEDVDNEDTSRIDGPAMTIDCSIISRASSNLSRSSISASRLRTPSASLKSSLDSPRVSRQPRRALATSTPKSSPLQQKTPPKVATTSRRTSIPTTSSKSRLPQPSASPARKNVSVKSPSNNTISKPNTNVSVKSPTSWTDPQKMVASDATSSTKAAVVPPYNYQKPFVTNANTDVAEKKPSVQPNPKQMLVTTV